MESIVRGPDGREHRLTKQPLEIRYDPARDLLDAVAAGNDERAADPLADALYEGALRSLIGEDDVIVGFQILEFCIFDPEAGNIDALYGPQFSAPALGAEGISAGEIVEIAQQRLLS